MKRYLFVPATLLSLAVGVAIAGLWIWSHHSRAFLVVSYDAELTLTVANGVVRWQRWDGAIPHPWTSPPARSVTEGVLGFSFEKPGPKPAPAKPLGIRRAWLLDTPIWFYMLVSLVLPMCWLGGACKLRRRRWRGLCLRCGYDLQGTKQAGRSECPECGHQI